MIEMICPVCGRFLGVLTGEAQIKCPQCKALSTYRSNKDFEVKLDLESDEAVELN